MLALSAGRSSRAAPERVGDVSVTTVLASALKPNRIPSFDGTWKRCDAALAVNRQPAGGTYAVRDSKNPAAGHLAFSGTDWKAFPARIKQGDHDIA